MPMSRPGGNVQAYASAFNWPRGEEMEEEKEEKRVNTPLS